MPNPLDLTITGKPTPRTAERPSSGRQAQRPLSANRAKSLRSNIFGGASEEQAEKGTRRPKPRVKSAPTRNEGEEKASESAFKGVLLLISFEVSL